VVRAFFFERVHNDDRMKLLLKVTVFLLMNHEAACRPTFSTSDNKFLFVDSRSVLLSYYFVV
jgi:hypothetical protein